jgi:predicted HAD superfamily phosphohydrolase
MAFEEIYVSVSGEKYRAGKGNILKSQANLLRSLKSLNTVIILSRQRNDLKKNLHQKISSLKKEVLSLEKKLPEVEIPKELRREPEFTIEPIKDYSKKEKIEEELRLIQRKLEDLNNLAA